MVIETKRGYSLFLLLFFVLIFGTCARQYVRAAEVGTDEYEKRQSLKCNGSDIELITSCVGPNEDGNCPEQKVVFKDNSKVLIVDYIHHRAHFSDQSFVASVSCTEVNAASYVMLLNTNFGSCADCEWADLFSTDGSYIGSTKGMSNDDKIPFKPLPKELEALLFGQDPKGLVHERATFDVTRVR